MTQLEKIQSLAFEELQALANRHSSLKKMTIELFGSGSHSPSLRKRMLEMGVDLSGLKLRAYALSIEALNKNRAKAALTRGKARFLAAEALIPKILCENSSYSSKRARQFFLNWNSKFQWKAYICEDCGNPGEHNSKPLVLQIDHKNGNNKDHRLENLRFLCPNCHSQTETFTGRNAKRNRVKKLAGPTGFHPATSASTVRRSRD